MKAEQYVLVGVSRAREQWASDLTRWATSGAAPIEFVQCLTVEEALVVLGTGRRVSALLVTARGPGADRELVDAAASHGVPTIVVADPTVHRDWDALGVAAVVDHDGSPRTLVETLAATTLPVDRTRRPGRTRLHRSPGPRRGGLVAVMGTGGSGSSTVAMAVAQALAAVEGDVVLADGARRGDIAMYHHVGDVVPGLPELVEAHRRDRIDPAEVRDLTHPVVSRGYSVLLGCRRASDWVTLRRRSVDAALDALQRSFERVVLDVDADLDGHRSTGSADVEDRHAVTLAAVERCDLVLVTGRPDLHGVHCLARLLDDVLDAGVPPERVVPVVVGTARSSMRRARMTSDLTGLSGHSLDGGDTRIQAPVLVRRHRDLDGIHDRVAQLPTSICRPFAARVPRLAQQLGARSAAAPPYRVRPGELGIDLDDAAEQRHHVA